MDKLFGNYDPETGEIKDANGNVLAGIIEVDGVKLGRAILADAVWQGCNRMKQERDSKDTHPDRRAFLDGSIKKSVSYHYILLGCSEEKAKKLADEFLQDGI